MCATLRTMNASESQHLKSAMGECSPSLQLWMSGDAVGAAVVEFAAFAVGGDCGLWNKKKLANHIT